MENNKTILKKGIIYVLSVIVWIFIWDIGAKCVDNPIFLPSPKKVLFVLFSELIYSDYFWSSLFNSIFHISEGFIIGLILGVILAVLASGCRVFDIFIWFPIKVIKTVPVASFVILTLLWYDSEHLAVIIPAMIVLPTLYINTQEGIKQTDAKLLKMADLYRISLIKRIRNIYIPSVLPYILSASSLAVGMAWKSGIAAEIIGLSKNSIGNELYKAKLYLMIPELFAWTIVIIILSVICETIIKVLMNCRRQK